MKVIAMITCASSLDIQSANFRQRRDSDLPPIVFDRSPGSREVFDKKALEGITKSLDDRGRADGKGIARMAIMYSVRRALPYGKWTLFDGTEILFNREYQPIMKKKDGSRSYCDHNLWVDHTTIEKQTYFYDDSCDPMSYVTKHLGGGGYGASAARESKKSILICMRVLKDFTPKEHSSVNGDFSALEL